MCWSCNPYCGNCKPPKEKPKKCPVCSSYSFPEFKNCKKCGALLPESVKPPTLMCLYIGEMCANPCGKRKTAPKDDILLHTCKWHTPPKSTLPESDQNLTTDKLST